MTNAQQSSKSPADELTFAGENYECARREYNADRISLRALDIARERLTRAENAMDAAMDAAMALPAPMPSPIACATLAKHAVIIARELTAMDRYDRDALAVTVESELREIAADGVFAAYPDFVRNVAHGAAMMAPTIK